MKFKDIYYKTIEYYPIKIDVSDGRIFEGTNGFLSNNLSDAWDLAETCSQNEWEALLIWNIYQMLHRKARSLYQSSEPRLITVADAIDLDDLEKMYFEALHVEGYEDMLEEYLR